MSSSPEPAGRDTRRAPRRTLSGRQARTVARLTEAVSDVLRAAGYDALTVRAVARHAGVAPATAYTYFASKEHLVTEAFWRRLSDLDPPAEPDRRRSVGARVTASLDGFSRLAAAEPELVAACTVAMVVDDPDVRELRERVGAEIHRRFAVALGDEAHPEVLAALDLAMTGALLRAGTGHMDYASIGDAMASLATRLVDR